jgi:hypothetical protein
VTGRPADIETYAQLAAAVRAGDDADARFIAERAGIPLVLLKCWALGPRGAVGTDDAATALSCMSALAAGGPAPVRGLSRPAVIDVVADAVEIVAEPNAGHPWLRGITTLGEGDCPGVRDLLLARAAEGSGRCDEARLLIGSCLRAAPRLRPAVRDAMEYELCAGNWAHAFELASTLGDDDIAEPLIRPLDRLRAPAGGAERAGRNQPCPCGSGRKYKMCCRAKDLAGGTHRLPDRAPALYAMLASYAKRGQARQVADRMAACVIGAPHPAMLALDLAIFDGGIAGRFLRDRGHLLRPDERDLLGEWLTRPVDMYEVTRVRHGSELTLRSIVGGPQRIRQRDRLFSMSVRRLDIVIGRLLPDGSPLPDGGQYLRALGGMAILPRDLRENTQVLFPGGPVGPGADPVFPARLLSRFAQQAQTVFQTADADEYRFCETAIEVSSARDVWDRLTKPCLSAPEPPIRDVDGYNAYLARHPAQFWVRNSADDEIEHVGQVEPGRLTNLGTIRRRHGGFLVTANSVRRAAGIEAVVLKAAAFTGQEARVTARSTQTADELMGRTSEPGEEPGSREAMCRRLGVEAALAPVEPRVLLLEEYFLPLEDSTAEAVVREINREIGLRSMLESTDYEGLTPAAAVAAGGTARDRVLATIDDCEWRLARAEAQGKDASFMPHPDELRRRLGILPGR